MPAGADVPTHDPTELTTDQLEKMEARLMANINERFAAYDKTIMQMFASVDRRFKEMTDHRLEQKADSVKALDAALDAAKNQIAALSTRVDDNRDGLTRVQAGLAGKQSQVVEQRSAKDSTSSIVALGIAAFVAVVGVISFILSIFTNGSSP